MSYITKSGYLEECQLDIRCLALLLKEEWKFGIKGHCIIIEVCDPQHCGIGYLAYANNFSGLM